ncbi:hypothetical protein PC123_g22079 [Phytophthora cactorum]|nr:hypothetical protein PC123_g22079 [Phytophthora cactorum]
MATEFTAYGTSSLASDERLSAHSAARRKWIRWGLISASTGIILAGMVALGISSHSVESIMATATPDEGDIKCFQSSYVDNVTHMMEPIKGLKWKFGGEKNTESFIAIDVDTKFQEIMGFGGAFTEAAALQFHKLPKDKQEEVLTLYFDKNEGSAYSFGRVPMGSCDFSVASSLRQAIHRTEDNKMQVTGTSFCLDLVKTPTGQHEVRLVECRWTPQTWNFEEDTQRIRIDDYCLTLNHGSTEDGVRITADKCETEVASYQQWTFNAEDGTMRSHASTSNQCVTAGNSFVQAAAFVAPQNRKVLVVLNENTEPADFQVQVGNAVLDTTISPGAIRTYIWA